MPDPLSSRLVPDELWALVEPLLPQAKARPQGGGRARTDARTVFTAIVFVLTSECAWRQLPPVFGVTVPTAHRAFTEWTEAGLWRRLRRALHDQHRKPAAADWALVILDAADSRVRGGVSTK